MIRLLRLAAVGALLAGPAWCQTMASPGAPARAAAAGSMGMGSGSMGASSAARPGATMTPVNVNTATEAQLDAIPQIGPKRAQAIIAHRPYTVPSDLVTKKAVSQGIFNKIKANVTTN